MLNHKMRAAASAGVAVVNIFNDSNIPRIFSQEVQPATVTNTSPAADGTGSFEVHNDTLVAWVNGVLSTSDNIQYIFNPTNNFTVGDSLTLHLKTSILTVPNKVTHGGNDYTCIVDNVGVEPGVTVGWATYWQDDGAGSSHDAWSGIINYKAESNYEAPLEVQYRVVNRLPTMDTLTVDATSVDANIGIVGVTGTDLDGQTLTFGMSLTDNSSTVALYQNEAAWILSGFDTGLPDGTDATTSVFCFAKDTSGGVSLVSISDTCDVDIPIHELSFSVQPVINTELYDGGTFDFTVADTEVGHNVDVDGWNGSTWESVLSNVAVGAKSDVELSGLAAGAIAYVKFRTVHTGETSGYVESDLVTSFNTVAPVLSDVTAGNAENTLTFADNANDTADTFTIKWGFTTGVLTETPITSATSPYVHTGRTNGVEVFYAIVAIKGGLESTASAEDSGTPVAATDIDDTFTVSSDTALGSHVSDNGRSWDLRVLNLTPAATVYAATDHIEGTTPGIFVATQDLFDTDQDVTVQFVDVDVTRLAYFIDARSTSDSSDIVLISFNSDSGSRLVRLREFVDNVAGKDEIDTVEFAEAASYKARVVMSGTTCTVYVNDVLVKTFTGLSALNTGTKAGFRTSETFIGVTSILSA